MAPLRVGIALAQGLPAVPGRGGAPEAAGMTGKLADKRRKVVRGGFSGCPRAPGRGQEGAAQGQEGPGHTSF